jgi:amino acid transporter
VIWLIASVLGLLNVDVSARVLMYVMVVEVAVVLVFDLAVASRGGASGLSLAPFDVGEFFSRGGDAAVGMLFAMLVFIGFEATALYRDEVEDPSRTIPRATYFAIVFIGLLYTATVWMMVSAFGGSAEQVANDDTAGMFGLASDRFIGAWFTDTATILLITAVLAAVLSIHNAATRYVFNLGADGALPHALGAVHGKHRSPYLASAVISTISVIGIIPYAIAGSDPSAVYSQLAGLGNAGVLILMALVSVSVIVWFRTHGRDRGEGRFATVYAPVVAGAGMAALVVYALWNFDLVTGSTGLVNWLLIAVLVIAFIAGLGRALHMRGHDERRYAALGGGRG